MAGIKHDIFYTPERKPSVDVVIKKSNLTGENYASVVSKKIDMMSLIKSAVEHSKIKVDFNTIYFATLVLGEEMMKYFENGYTIDLLDFGELSPEMKGKVNPTDTPLMLQKQLEPSFKPSKKTKKAVENLTVNRVRDVAVQHTIYYIADFYQREMRKTLTNPDLVFISGKGIKLAEKEPYCYAAKVSKDFNSTFNRLPEKSEWKKVFIIESYPSRIIARFNELEEGFYVLILHTPYSAGGKKLKQEIEVASDVFEIKRA